MRKEVHTSMADDNALRSSISAFCSSHFRAQALFVEVESANFKTVSSFTAGLIDGDKILIYNASFLAVLEEEVSVAGRVQCLEKWRAESGFDQRVKFCCGPNGDEAEF